MSKTAFLFAGQGTQTVGMGKDLVERHSSAGVWCERANQALGYDLAALCANGPPDELTRTENAQPAIYLVGWIAFQLLREQAPTIAFSATAGLSLGEFTALAAAGVVSFEDGLRTVRLRGRFMQEACDRTQGGMAAILGLDEKTTREVCTETGVQLANLNCPGQLVISGETARVTQACELAKTRGAKRALSLAVAGAFHSPLMKSAQPKLEEVLEGIPLSSPSVTVISNVTARPHGTSFELKKKLVEQVTSPVRWEESMRFLLNDGYTRFIELGPGTALTGFMKRIDPKVQMLNVADAASLETTLKAVSATDTGA